MASKTTEQRIARSIQEMCEVETGVRPSYMRCLNIARTSPALENTTGMGREEKAAALYLAHRSELSRPRPEGIE